MRTDGSFGELKPPYCGEIPVRNTDRLPVGSSAAIGAISPEFSRV
jgi:hypothetical protein